MTALGVRCARWSWALACCLALSSSACQKHGPSEGEGAEAGGQGEDAGAADGGQDSPSPIAKDDRIPALEGTPVGPQPGYVAGALLYASWRAGAAQELLQSIPIEPREARDIAEAGALLGVDLRGDDVLGEFGVAHDARVSLSVRPVSTWAAEVRGALEQNSPVLQELARSNRSHMSRPVIEKPPQIDSIEPPEPPPPPAPLSAAAIELDRKAKSLGVHVRVHVPVADPAKFDRLVSLLAREVNNNPEGWQTTCAALGKTRICDGHGDGLLVVRDAPGGVQVDALLTFSSDYEQPDDEFRRTAMQQALAVPGGDARPELSALRGDAVLLVDGPGVVEVLRNEALTRHVSTVGEEDDYYTQRIRSRDRALWQLHETQRLFEGLSVEASYRDDLMVATTRWLATDFGRSRMASIFELAKIDADVPTISALCDGALICGRSRGAANRRLFAELATGIYAQPRELAELMDDHEEESMSVLMLETWPNALGTLAQLPGAVMDAPESMMVQSVIEVVERALGFGFSIRSIAATRRVVTGDWVAYARVSAADLAILRGFAAMGGMTMVGAAIPDVPGRVEFAPIPERDLPGNIYGVYDPVAETGEWGWAVAADGDDRVRWLAGLAHDDGSAPLVYAEIGDLWRLVAAFEEGRQELGFAQSWLSRRWVRGQVSLGQDGAPQLRMAMGKASE